jgi:hypothetical protein
MRTVTRLADQVITSVECFGERLAQSLTHLRCGGVPIGDGRSTGAGTHALEALGEFRHGRPEASDTVERGLATLVRVVTAQQLEQEDADSEKVPSHTPSREVGIRRSIARRPTNRERRLSERRRDVEVDQQCFARRTVIHDVLGLDVSVNETLPLQSFQLDLLVVGQFSIAGRPLELGNTPAVGVERAAGVQQLVDQTNCLIRGEEV